MFWALRTIILVAIILSIILVGVALLVCLYYRGRSKVPRNPFSNFEDPAKAAASPPSEYMFVDYDSVYSERNYGSDAPMEIDSAMSTADSTRVHSFEPGVPGTRSSNDTAIELATIKSYNDQQPFLGSRTSDLPASSLATSASTDQHK